MIGSFEESCEICVQLFFTNVEKQKRAFPFAFMGTRIHKVEYHQRKS